MTDFQDMLSTFKAGKLLNDDQLNKQKSESRKLLDSKSKEGDTQRVFTFINNICKHKINNIHICNHHLHTKFADSNEQSNSESIIRINNINLFITKDPNDSPQKVADSVEMPKLEEIIDRVIMGYQIVNESFQGDTLKFECFCSLYKGKSVR